MTDKTALSYWFPIIEGAGLPVPKTLLVDMPEGARKAVWSAFDGQDDGDMAPFIESIKDAANEVGFPCFLRTDHTSGKHSWEDTCHLPNAEAIPRRIMGLAEFSEMASMFGELSWDKWVVREFLPTKPVGVCHRFGNMPICREFRFFVDGENVICRHPYWPIMALEQGGAEYHEDFDYGAFCTLSVEEDAELTWIAARAGKVLGGAWSVDLLETEGGWFLTDMAEAHKSYHWPDCPHDFKTRVGA